MDPNLNIELRAVAYREDGQWVSHCLEMDVCGTGSDAESAFQQMVEAVSVQIHQSVERCNPDNIFMPADPKYFRMFFEAKRKSLAGAEGWRTAVVDGVSIGSMDTRQYTGLTATA